MRVPFVLNLGLIEKGIKVYEQMDLDTYPHILCVGATGAGKSYALALLLGKISLYSPDVRFVVCDYKKSSFGWLEDSSSFFGYEKVSAGVEAVYSEFLYRLEANDSCRNAEKIVLLIDEYGAFISALDKKAADDMKRKIGNILLMGRSLGIHLIIGIQRADAEYFRAGARDQFTCTLMLGNLSKEQKAMLAPDYKDSMVADNQRGQGYLLMDGLGIRRIQVPVVSDLAKLQEAIRDKMITMPLGDVAGEA